MPTGGDNSWFLYLPKYKYKFLPCLCPWSKNIVFCVFECNLFAINQSRIDVVNINEFLLLLRMRITETRFSLVKN